MKKKKTLTKVKSASKCLATESKEEKLAELASKARELMRKQVEVASDKEVLCLIRMDPNSEVMKLSEQLLRLTIQARQL